MTSLADANWKTRLAAMEEITEWIEGNVTELDAEVVIRALAKKGWSDKNFQVCAFDQKAESPIDQNLAGVQQALRCSLTIGGEVPVFRTVVRCTLCASPHREAG